MNFGIFNEIPVHDGITSERAFNGSFQVFHAAEELGIADPFAVMPEEYAHRLRQRAAHKKLPRNQGGTETQAAMHFLLGKGN